MAARVGLTCSIAIVLLVGCNGPVTGLFPPGPGEPSVEIFFVNNHWHTGLVLQRAAMSPRLRELTARFEGSHWIEIGWGDDAFYRAPKGTSGLAVRAMFASHASVLHVVGLPQYPPEYYEGYVVDLYRIRLSRLGFHRLLNYLENSFQTHSAGDSVPIEPGLYGDSFFYAARGKYGACHTCNHWSADGLRETGFPITPFYALLADNVGWQVRVFGRKYESDLIVQLQ